MEITSKEQAKWCPPVIVRAGTGYTPGTTGYKAMERLRRTGSRPIHQQHSLVAEAGWRPEHSGRVRLIHALRERPLREWLSCATHKLLTGEKTLNERCRPRRESRCTRRPQVYTTLACLPAQNTQRRLLYGSPQGTNKPVRCTARNTARDRYREEDGLSVHEGM